ncbi:hypothetical protein ACP70R_015364 [Stipagrostis hirtigluma subsp. patula]
MGPNVIKLLAMAAIVTALALPASGQQAPTSSSASCTSSLVTSFTPCLNFITSSTNGGGGGSPTAGCCRSLAALVNASTGCACLILTGNVPLGVPINRTLAVTLPKACNSMSVPLQCRDTSTQIPAPGPVAVSPAMPPLPPATPEPEAPVEPTDTSPVSQGETRPALLPSSAGRTSSQVSATAAFVLLLAVGGGALI